jgi:hypothetical protein
LTGGSATPAGSFAFTTPSTTPSAGTAAQSVTYTPTDTANYNTATGTVDVTVTGASTFNLSVTIDGTGIGSVNSNPGGIACASGSSSNCSHDFAPTPDVVLTASVGGNSIFAGWSGGGCSGTGTCTVTLAGTTVVNATFNIIPLVRIGTTDHATITSAYTAAADGATIMARTYTFIEDLTLDRAISVILAGGYDAGYSSAAGVTSIQGSLTITDGTVTVSGLEIL